MGVSTRLENKQESIALFYTKGTTYEITINPDDAHQCLKSDDRTESVYNLMSPIIRKYLKCKYTLYTELSEPQHMNCVGGFPRVHFHGIITLDNVTRFKENLHYLSYCTDIQINKYEPEYWDEYMTKSVPQITADIGKRYTCMKHDDPWPIGIPLVERPDNFFKRSRAKR